MHDHTDYFQKLYNEGRLSQINYIHLIKYLYVGQKQEKDGSLENLHAVEGDSLTTFNYYLNVVPTISVDKVMSYPFTMNSNTFKRMNGVPSVVFRYEFSPIVVEYKEKQKDLLEVLINICAVIGGIYTVFEIFDAIVYTSMSKIFKERINKLG